MPSSRWVPCISRRSPCRCRGGTPRARPHGHRARALGHDAREPGDLGRVGQDVLPVTRAELQASHQPQDLGMQIVQAEFKGDGAAFLADLLVGFFLDLLNDLLDARRVDASVGNELLDRLLRDLPPVGIESREDDGAWRVVDDQVDAGGELERADVASFAADDAALEIVARQIDNETVVSSRARRRALDGFRDVVLGAVDGRLARLGVESFGRFAESCAPRLRFVDQQFLGFVGREARDALSSCCCWRPAVHISWRRPRRVSPGRRPPVRACGCPCPAGRRRPASP